MSVYISLRGVPFPRAACPGEAAVSGKGRYVNIVSSESS